MVIPMQALNRKLLRDLWRMKGQVAAIGAVVAMGVMMLVMMSGLFVSLQETRRTYYERCRFADVFAPVKCAPQILLSKLAAIPGVAAVRGRVIGDVLMDLPGLDLPIRGQVLSLPDNNGAALNDVHLRVGRIPEGGNANEILLLQSFASAHGLKPGDTLSVTLNGSHRRLHIVGLAQAPELLYVAAPGEVGADDARYGVLWMGHGAIQASYGLTGAFNEALLALDRNACLSSVLAAADRILEPYGGLGAYGRNEHASNRFVDEELRQLSSMSVLMPPLFLTVAAFLLTLVVSRMVQSEREYIGLLKAFGYSHWAVGLHYFKLILVIAILGAAAGCVFGVMSGRWMVQVYLLFFKFPFLTFRIVPAPFVIGFLASIGAASTSGCFVLRRVFALTPASAMRPPVPPDYSRTGNRGRGIGAHLDQPCKMVLRRLLRRPGRMAGATLGIASGMALSVSMISILASFDAMLDLTFNVIDRSDIAVIFNEALPARSVFELRHLPGVIEAEPMRSVPVILRHGLLTHHGTLDGLIPSPRLHRALDSHLNEIFLKKGGVVLARPLAKALNAREGDVLDVEVRAGNRPKLSLPVVGVSGTVLGAPAYMDLETLNRALHEPRRVSSVFLRIDGARSSTVYRELKGMPSVAGVRMKNEALKALRYQMDAGAGAMRYILLAVAGVVAFGIVYNSANIAYTERARDLASLRVMGFTQGEAAFVLLGELAVVTLAALPIGVGLGYLLSRVLAESFSTELYQIPHIFSPASAGMGSAVVLSSAVASGWLVKRTLDRADLVSVIKTRE